MHPMSILSPGVRVPVISKKEKVLFAQVFLESNLIIEVLKWIKNHNDRKACALTCHKWQELTEKINYAQVILKIESINFPVRVCFLLALAPVFSSPLTPADKSWLTFPRVFCINGDLIAIKADPLFFSHITTHFHSSKPNSFVFNQDYLLIEYKGTYLFQSPFNSEKLVVTQNPSTLAGGKEIFLSNLTPLNDNGIFGDSIDLSSSDEEEDENYASRVGFPVSEEKMVLLTKEKRYLRASCLDVNEGQITKTCLLKYQPVLPPIMLENYLIFETIMVNLETLKVLKHEFDFTMQKTAAHGSMLYVLGRNHLEAYFINLEGKLENKWKVKSFKSKGDKKAMDAQYFAAVNDRYVAFMCIAKDLSNQFWCIHLVDKEKNFIEEIRFAFEGFYKCKGDLPAHLIDDIFIYQDPKTRDLIFWHIPTKQCIQQIKWNGSYIFNMLSTKDKLIVLTSTDNIESKYQIHQFNLSSFISAPL